MQTTIDKTKVNDVLSTFVSPWDFDPDKLADSINLNPKARKVRLFFNIVIESVEDFKRFLELWELYGIENNMAYDAIDDLHMEKIKKNPLSYIVFSNTFKNSKEDALRLLFQHKIYKHDISMLEKLKITPQEIYEAHMNNVNMELPVLLSDLRIAINL